MVYVIASTRHWNMRMPKHLSDATGHEFHFIDNNEDLCLSRLVEIDPRYIFFPHWSYIIPSSIYDRFECVVFHMTDVPFGRGGSPLQNLISRGIYETKMTALRCSAGIDAGDVYLKEPLSLYGTAEEIYLRAGKLIEEMIKTIIASEPKPVPQEGEIVQFPRRKPEDGSIEQLTELDQVFDYIRMLDADGYPKAFLETEHFRLEFQRAAMQYGKITSDVIITKKGPL